MSKKKRKADCIVQPTPWVHFASLGLEEATRFIANRTSQVAEVVKAKVTEIKEQSHDEGAPGRAPNDWSTILERFATLSWYDRELVDPGPRLSGTELSDDPGWVVDLLLEKYEAQAAHLAQLKEGALAGNEDPQYHLAQLFCPPAFKERNACYSCQGKFGFSRYRHHCRMCGESFCHYDSRWQWRMPNHGFNVPVRVCRACCALLSREARADRVAWKLMRVKAYLNHELKPYFNNRVDNNVDKAARIMEGAIFIAKKTPLPTSCALAVEAVNLLSKYGPFGVATILLRQEFVKAVELLCKVSGVDEKWPRSIHKVSAAMYYQLAHSRGKRGDDPGVEARLHESMDPLSQDDLNEILFYAPLPLFFMYDHDPMEAQLLAGQQGWKMVYVAMTSEPEQPAYGLFAHLEKNVAALVIRGTHSIQDIVTDIRAKPVPFGEKPDTSQLGGKPKKDRGGRELGGDWGLGEEDLEVQKSRNLFESNFGKTESMAMCGIARAAEWLYCEVYHSLVALHKAGTQVVLLGHSLGAAVASMTAELLVDEIPGIKCFAFATPACATRSLAVQTQQHTTSIILRDDVIPRITPASVRFLMQDLMLERQRFEEDFGEDMAAAYERVMGIWTPRHRQLPMGKRAATKVLRTCKNALHFGTNASNPKKPCNCCSNPCENTQEANENTEDLSSTCKTSSDAVEEEVKDHDQDVVMLSTNDTSMEYLAGRRRKHKCAKCQRCTDVSQSSLVCNLDETDVNKSQRIQSKAEIRENHFMVYKEVIDLSGSGMSSEIVQMDNDAPDAPIIPSRSCQKNLRQNIPPENDSVKDFHDKEQKSEGNSKVYEDNEMKICINTEQHEKNSPEHGLLKFNENEMVVDNAATVHSADAKCDGPHDPNDVQIVNVINPEPESQKGDELPPEPETGMLKSAQANAGNGGSFQSHEEVQVLDAWAVESASEKEDAVPTGSGIERCSVSTEHDDPHKELIAQPVLEDDEEALLDNVILVDEMIMPEQFIPGKIVHLYSHHGVYKASHVPQTFADLRQINMVPNMVEDHGSGNYYSALCEVRDVLDAKEEAPEWVPFSATDNCQTCDSPFTWHSTSSSKAQVYRDKHNCRRCGSLVCEPCSKQIKPIPKIGLHRPVRVCDKCFYNNSTFV